jgi:hypothetical protein
MGLKNGSTIVRYWARALDVKKLLSPPMAKKNRSFTPEESKIADLISHECIDFGQWPVLIFQPSLYKAEDLSKNNALDASSP